MQARLAALRPAWLVLRPFIVAMAAMHLLDGQFLRQDANVAELAVVAIVGSLGVGVSQRIAAGEARWDRLATVAGVISIVVVAVALNAGQRYVYVDSAGYQPPGVVTRGDGSVVTNIWAYDRDGNPVDVFLFDQNGRPIDDVGTDGYDERTGEQLTSSVRTDADGRPIPNLYPREQNRVRYDDHGFPRERRDRPPVFVTPQLEPEPTTTSTSTTTTTSTTAAPTTTAQSAP
jgi:hypothetical protein